jgi:hypothetical protein
LWGIFLADSRLNNLSVSRHRNDLITLEIYNDLHDMSSMIKLTKKLAGPPNKTGGHKGPPTDNECRGGF